jgi:hypothetical protein
MKGHIQQRGKNSWRLKFDAGRDEKTGKRKTQFVTFRGTKRQAQVKLAELIASVSQAKYVEPNKVTVCRVGSRPCGPMGICGRYLGADGAAVPAAC